MENFKRIPTCFKTATIRYLFFTIIVFAFPNSASHVQLVECNLVNLNGNVDAPGGCIGRPLVDQIGPGQGDENTFGSSIYLIKRDPARAIRRGRQLFQRKFSTAEGLGPRVNFDSSGDITQVRALGAGLADSCAACHGRPRGSAGFGGDVNTRPDSRDAPHLFGLGIVEQLAEEMTQELRAIRDDAVAQAQGGTGEGAVIVENNFDAGVGQFQFVRDVFGASPPQYVDSTLAESSPGNRRAVIILGGVDNADIVNMSGGWQTNFNLSAPADIEIEFTYRIIQQPDYESDEFTQAIVDVDGQSTLVDTLTGNGNGGGQLNSRP